MTWNMVHNPPTDRQRNYVEALLDKLQEAGECIYDFQRRYYRCRTATDMSDLIDDLKSAWEENRSKW